jgi:hypothetical protein
MIPKFKWVPPTIHREPSRALQRGKAVVISDGAQTETRREAQASRTQIGDDHGRQ